MRSSRTHKEFEVNLSFKLNRNLAENKSTEAFENSQTYEYQMALLNILYFEARFIRAASVKRGDKATLAVIFVLYNLINMAHVLYC